MDGLKYPRSLLLTFGAGLAIIGVGIVLSLVSLLVRDEVVVYSSLLCFIVGGLLVYGALEHGDDFQKPDQK